jgi:hypothetical protein
MPTPKKVTLNWEKWPSMGEAIRSELGRKHKTSVVYCIADPELCPLYIGKSNIPKGGFYERYGGWDRMIDAAMAGTNKQIFVAETKPSLNTELEKFLIAKEQEAKGCQFNKRVLISKVEFNINHLGNMPHFRYLNGSLC